MERGINIQQKSCGTTMYQKLEKSLKKLTANWPDNNYTKNNFALMTKTVKSYIKKNNRSFCKKKNDFQRKRSN